MKTIFTLFSILAMTAALLSACAPGGMPPAGDEPVQQPAATETLEPVPPTPYDAPIEPPAAALKARAELAKFLNVAEAEIMIETIEEKEWPDACLGAAMAREVCAAVITPGYRVVLTVDGSTFEMHTNLDGSVVRQARTLPTDAVHGPGTGDAGELGQTAIDLLVEQAGLPVESIQLVKSQPMEWPNACLGAAEPGEACAEMIVAGYKFDLQVEGRTYYLHTNQDLSQARLGGPQETTAIVKVRQQAALEKGVGLEEVKLVSSEAVEWRNSCLGIERDGMMCLMVITPGYRIKVEVLNTVLEYHTNQSASAVAQFIP